MIRLQRRREAYVLRVEPLNLAAPAKNSMWTTTILREPSAVSYAFGATC